MIINVVVRTTAAKKQEMTQLLANSVASGAFTKVSPHPNVPLSEDAQFLVCSIPLFPNHQNFQYLTQRAFRGLQLVAEVLQCVQAPTC